MLIGDLQQQIEKEKVEQRLVKSRVVVTVIMIIEMIFSLKRQ